MAARAAARLELQFASEPSRGMELLRNAGLALAGTALIAAAAHIAIPLPFTPVPFTLQPLAVLLVGLLYAPALAFSTLCLYLLEGLAGLPVFQPLGMGGVAQLLEPTGGFLLAYPFVAALAGWVFKTLRSSSRFTAGTLAGLASMTILFAAGAGRLGTMLHLSLRATLIAAVLPFLPAETMKVFAAAGIASAWQRRSR